MLGLDFGTGLVEAGVAGVTIGFSGTLIHHKRSVCLLFHHVNSTLPKDTGTKGFRKGKRR